MKLLKMANPVTATKSAVGLAGSAVGLAGTVARDVTHLALSRLHLLGEPGAGPAGAGQTPTPAATDVTDAGSTPTEPTIVSAEPHAPEEPPVDVVGQALAAEAALGDRETPEGAGLAHEPRGASRDEEHGDAPLQRAEVDGIADEVTAALEGDPEPEEHLTEPLLDPADRKALAAEMQTMIRAADPHQA